MLNIDWKNLKSKVVFVAFIQLLLGLYLLGMGLTIFPALDGVKLDKLHGLWPLFVSAYTFSILYEILNENDVNKFRWAITIFLVGFLGIIILEKLSTLSIFILPVLVIYILYSCYTLYLAAKPPQEKSRKVLCWLLIPINLIILIIAVRISGF